MAELPVPGPELTAADTAGEPVDQEAIGRLVPEQVLDLLRTLWSAGHSAYVVGGSLRDALLGRVASDWDLASDALPERTVELLPGAARERTA